MGVDGCIWAGATSGAVRGPGVGVPAGSAAITLSDPLVLLAANRAPVPPGQARRRRSTGSRG